MPSTQWQTVRDRMLICDARANILYANRRAIELFRFESDPLTEHLGGHVELRLRAASVT